VIVTERLTRRFGSIEAVRDLSLTVPDGSICGFIGANGAGKTTTLKLLMNLIAPTSGQATVLGVDSRKLGPAQFAQIGYVSENQELPDDLTTRQLLAYLRPFYPTWDDALADRLCRLLDLPLDRRLKALSRGMRMKAERMVSNKKGEQGVEETKVREPRMAKAKKLKLKSLASRQRSQKRPSPLPMRAAVLHLRQQKSLRDLEHRPG